MDKIDKIIEERLQQEVTVVIDRYHSGKIRKEVEKELKEQQRKEQISNIARLPKASGLKNNLHILWLRFSNNKAYYDAVFEVGGNEACQAIKKEMAGFLALFLVLVLISLCYTCGWPFLDTAKEYYADTLAGEYSATYAGPIELAIAYALLATAPFFISIFSLIFAAHWCKDSSVPFGLSRILVGLTGVLFLIFILWANSLFPVYFSLACAITISILFSLLLIGPIFVIHTVCLRFYDLDFD